MLYCATRGSADVRIQNAVDVLVDESIVFKDQAIQMTRYGNSSGADLFVGITIAIQILQERYGGNINGKSYPTTLPCLSNLNAGVFRVVDFIFHICRGKIREILSGYSIEQGPKKLI